jgi:hypothetical protein
VKSVATVDFNCMLGVSRILMASSSVFAVRI